MYEIRLNQIERLVASAVRQRISLKCYFEDGKFQSKVLESIMTEHRLNDLEASLFKWKLIANYADLGFRNSDEGLVHLAIECENGSFNCALCMVYFKDDCKDCPVAAKVGEPNCVNTPYEDWSYYKHQWETCKIEDRPCFAEPLRNCADQEVYFLKGLGKIVDE